MTAITPITYSMKLFRQKRLLWNTLVTGLRAEPITIYNIWVPLGSGFWDWAKKWVSVGSGFREFPKIGSVAPFAGSCLKKRSVSPHAATPEIIQTCRRILRRKINLRNHFVETWIQYMIYCISKRLWNWGWALISDTNGKNDEDKSCIKQFLKNNKKMITSG